MREPGAKVRTWAAVRSVCYYPIDLEAKTGVTIAVSRTTGGRVRNGELQIEAVDYGVQEITLPDIPQANPSPADFERDRQEGIRLGKIFTRPESPPRFTLPLGPPARPLPKGESFGVKRVFNGKPADQPHMGIDYPVPLNSPIIAAAPGTVVLADDLFFEGNSVFIDHGNGLISMYLHLKDITAAVGHNVRKGQVIGHVGSTGRSTGPHLFFGVRWHNARIDPKFLLGPPADIPVIPSN
jgi:murein DD-endopeptidase MepM/ murein hydrolase activator NlpD